MSSRWLSLWLPLAAALGVCGSAKALTYKHTEVARVGDPAPGTGGGIYAFIQPSVRLSISGTGDVLFNATVTGGSTPEGLFVASGDTDRAVALVGDPAPGTGGGTYTNGSFGPQTGLAAINSAGDVVFYSKILGGNVPDGIFLDSSGTHTAVALPGDPAPGTGAGTYELFDFCPGPSINNTGDVLYWARVLGGTALRGLFVASGGTHTAVALSGQVAPGTGGGTFAAPRNWSINDAGDVVFTAFVLAGSVGNGIFLASGGTITPVALSGDPAPGTGGGTYALDMNCGNYPSLDVSGNVAFYSAVTGGSKAHGIFLASQGTVTPVAFPGDPAPGGGVYDSLSEPWSNAAGDLAFGAVVSGSQSVFLVSAGSHSAVALAGSPAPGGTFFSAIFPKINTQGAVTFFGTLVGGLTLDIYKAEPVIFVPTLGPYGLAIAGCVLALIAAVAASKVSGPSPPGPLRRSR